MAAPPQPAPDTSSTQHSQQPPPPPPPHPSIRQSNATAFTRDLEFLSSLANPYYLHNLAVQGHLEEPSLLLYLQHLNYFRHPRYVKYLQYPHALYMLDLLQHHEFREALKDQAWANEVAARQARHWATWRDPASQNGTEGQEQAPTAQQPPPATDDTKS